MSARLVVLWRHGQTRYNAAMRLQGQVDIELNEVGVEQAERAAAGIAALGPTRIVSSDLQRAARTAQALGDRTGRDVELDPRLRERSFGQWEGLTAEEIQAGWPEAHQAWRRGQEPADIGAESRGDVAARVSSAVRETADGMDDGVLVVVAHGAALTLGLTALLDLDPTEWFGLAGLDNCRWSVLTGNPGRRPEWRLTGHNLGVAGT
ncbi:histidine phosphatase family protein [Georgenia faecalis]|uniref:Histidine phosphatase family protein n=1 Tax=Georgenia faecalis TaxID=2483799 RepID=A0ABV9DCG3_9MICO|nr:histidine phosphatase family protein [Georgenia faecalis]